MPTRILFRLLFLAGLLAPWCAFALGVGQLEVRSALNQTFEAELPLISSNPAELTGLVARIPRQEEFDRAGVERLELLSKLRFSVQAPPGGRSVVRMTSLEPIREPNFNLLLELVWPRGRMIREFAIQLDPELYANRRLPPPPPIVAPPSPVVVAAPAPPPAAPVVPQLPPAPPVSFEGASFYGPVKAGETLAAIANRARPSTAISLPQMMAILMAGNPSAFANGNPNALRSGATLKVPTPQALGVTVAAPAPELAVAPTPAGPALASVPPDLTPSSPPSASAPELAPSVEPGTSPPPITTTRLPPPPAVETPPPTPGSTPPLSAEQPQEIVPRATIPQPEAPPAPVQPQPAAAAPPPAPVQPQPAAAAPPPAPVQPQPAAAAPPPAPPPPEAEPGWISDPVVWIAVALIALAISALVLLPLLRRPARKPSVVEAVTLEFPEGESTAIAEPSGASLTRTQPRELGSARPEPAVAAPSVPLAAERVESAELHLMGAPGPRPIGELLKDFDFELGEKALPAVAVRQGGASAGEIKAPLLEAEPPTAPGTHRPVSSVETVTERAEQEKESAPPPRAELPPDLRLDGLDFDFGDLGLERIGRPQPSELPPLEMKLEPAGTKPPKLPSLELGIAEPATEPPSLKPSAAPAGAPPMPDLKFEFADVTQEIARQGAHEDALKLDEALQDLGGDSLKLGGQEEKVRALAGGMDNADYVETKLDLASAYLDMGDQVGARSLLEEVLREGSVKQKERAEEFLKKLG